MTESAAMAPVTLYGVPHSLYTARARSYFIKAGLAYREVAPNDPHYQKEVIAKAGGKLGLPTIECADGTVIRDGAQIIDHFEIEASGHSFSPKGPKQRFFSRLFDAIGAEGLLRPAMHYRWNFDAENLDFLTFHFEMLMPPGPKGAEMARGAADRMRGAMRAFGVNDGTIRMVEAVYAEQLAAFNAHFAEQPYLLGGRPCIGDFGLIAPLFGHLGRDPKPLSIMLAEAARVHRWVERMGREASDMVEFSGAEDAYLPDDAIPPTLIDLLKAMAIDFVPETLAAAETINAWIASQDELPSGAPCERMLGFCNFEVRGTEVSAIAQPYRFYLLKRAQDERAAMDAATRSEIDKMLEEASASELMDAQLTRAMGFKDNLEIWL